MKGYLEQGTILNERYRVDAVISKDKKSISYSGWDLVLNMRILIKEYRASEADRTWVEQHEITATLDVRDIFELDQVIYIIAGGSGIVTPNDSEGETAGDIKDADHAKPQSEGKRRGWIAGAVAVTVAAAVGFMAVLSGQNGKAGKQEETVVAAGADMDAVLGMDSSMDSAADAALGDENVAVDAAFSGLDPNEEYRYLIFPVENKSMSDVQDSLNLIRERVEILSDGIPYAVVLKEEQIKAAIPKKAFGLWERDYVTYGFICGRTELSAYCVDSGENFVIDREELEQVTLEKGTNEKIDGTIWGVDGDEYEYLKVVLTDQCAADHKEEIETWDSSLMLAFDVYQEGRKDGWYYFPTFSEGDGKTFYILDRDPSDKLAETMYYNLSHEELPINLLYRLDYNYEAEWEAVADAENPGTLQCDFNDVEGKTVTVFFRQQTEQSGGSVMDAEQAFKERMDALGMPYAYGTVIDTEEIGITVKTGLDHMGFPVFDMLTQSTDNYDVLGKFAHNIEIQVGMQLYTLNQTKELLIEEKEDRTYEVSVALDVMEPKELENLKSALKDAGEADVVLTVDRMPWLTADMAQDIENGVLTFDQICFEENGLITEENVWLVEALSKTISGAPFPLLYEMEQWQCNYDTNGASGTYREFGVSYESVADAVTEKIHAAVGDVTVVNYQDTSKLEVFLHLNLDETLPEQATSMAKEIYEAIEFETNVFQDVWIYLTDENNADRERARIHFGKHYGYMPDSGYCYVGGMFSGKRMEPYIAEFQSIVETDPFYIKGREVYDSWDFDVSYEEMVEYEKQSQPTWSEILDEKLSYMYYLYDMLE